ncbi:MAG: N-acetylglucosamine-6-phosphate deacetylase [Clostridia bacterium]|nr:N-acetylglucosamine-6-phosphate deacetylase [Clostridia bacterium]
MKGIFNGIFVLPDRTVSSGVLLFDSVIRGIVSEEEAKHCCDEMINAGGNYVTPGFVDVHVHGMDGKDVSDGTSESLRSIAEALLHQGVTSFCPTTMTISLPSLRETLKTCRALKEESKTWTGAEILGVHAEGPFLNPAQKGAQNEDHILPPNADFVLEYKDILSLMTIAPEVSGMEELIKTVRQNSHVVLSVGHTCADYESSKKAIEWGITHATHTFNAMVGLHHRNPGTVGAVLSDDRVYCELIADTFHVHPAWFSMLYRLKKERLLVVTDSIPVAGLPDGGYRFGDSAITLKGREARLQDGTIAGSVLTMNQALFNVVTHTDLPFYEAVNLLTRNPANSINAHGKGTLEVGKDADILILDSTFQIRSVFCRGKKKL